VCRCIIHTPPSHASIHIIPYSFPKKNIWTLIYLLVSENIMTRTASALNEQARVYMTDHKQEVFAPLQLCWRAWRWEAIMKRLQFSLERILAGMRRHALTSRSIETYIYCWGEDTYVRYQQGDMMSWCTFTGIWWADAHFKWYAEFNHSQYFQHTLNPLLTVRKMYAIYNIFCVYKFGSTATSPDIISSQTRKPIYSV
jgi:hypothetical protein